MSKRNDILFFLFNLLFIQRVQKKRKNLHEKQHLKWECLKNDSEQQVTVGAGLMGEVYVGWKHSRSFQTHFQSRMNAHGRNSVHTRLLNGAGWISKFGFQCGACAQIFVKMKFHVAPLCRAGSKKCKINYDEGTCQTSTSKEIGFPIAQKGTKWIRAAPWMPIYCFRGASEVFSDFYRIIASRPTDVRR